MKKGLLFLSILAGIVFFAQEGAAYEKINIVGEDSLMGVYDPSVEYDGSGVGWLAYTAMGNINVTAQLETHLAKSLDHGKTWIKAGKANSGMGATITIDDKPTKVIYRNETPALLYDPSDPDSSRRWKLFTARGFTTGKSKDTKWEYVHIAYKYAASPEKLSSAKEILLFGSGTCKPPACSVRYDLNDFHPDLKNVVFYEEPGTLAKDGVLYLTLSAVTRRGQKTILLSSEDHGETWKYVGTLTFRRDAEILGSDDLTSSSLAEEDGRVFLLVSPVKKIMFPQHLQYNGFYILEFDDISKGRLKRDGSGDLVVRKYIPAITTRSVGGGQSAYHAQNTYGGIIMAQSDARAPFERFQIFNTREGIAVK